MKRYIGTFHKTGSALFQCVLQKAGDLSVIRPWMLHREPEPDSWDIAFDYHSRTILEGLDSNPHTSRYVICIRDPRDVIVSAAYYHCTSAEAWLHRPMPRFDGRTYQETINSLPDMQERFMFEMENASYWEIDAMLKVPTNTDSLLVTRLETLVADYRLQEFDRIFSFLRLQTSTIVQMRDLAFECSLFSGKVKPSSHVRCGKPRQFETEFSDRVLRRYQELFGDAAERLGYEI